MRILVLGAGAVGGYFGGRLAEAGGDVTFLVRAPRAASLRKSGLVIVSPQGGVTLTPRLIVAGGGAPQFDIVILASKAYGLAGAMEAIAPFLHDETGIIPLLNGMAHVDVLRKEFGEGRVLGGTCSIGATLGDDGRVIHLTPPQSMTYGELDAMLSDRVRAFDAVAQTAKFEARASSAIRQDMWDKWVFLSSLAAGTCLMRASVGQIAACVGGDQLMLELLREASAVAAADGCPPGDEALAKARALLTDPASPMTSSLLRDIRAGHRIEGEHIFGDLCRRAVAAGVDAPLLALAHCHAQAYEQVRTEDGKT